jgi:broad specificity phosphatase PhoE
MAVGLMVQFLALVPVEAPADDGELWDALKSSGHVALLRHALAPGTGDPPEFDLRDCATQRNLSDEGRRQAARIGARFRANGMPGARVLSSQWCRCLETANLLGLGPVEELPVLNSFFQRRERRDEQTQDLARWLSDQSAGTPLVLVTHQVNITALTGIYPASGELVVVRIATDGEVTAVGTIETD